MRRAAVSVLLNIAEGAARRGRLEFRRHVGIALASLAELECGFIVAGDLGYQPEPSADLSSQMRRTARLLWRLHKRLDA